MTSQVTISLDKNYSVQVNDEIPVRLTSLAKLVEFLTYCVEFNTLAIEFSVATETLKPRQVKTFTNRGMGS